MKETIPIGSQASSGASVEGLGEDSGETSREAMITIVNDFSNAEVRVYVNAVLRCRYATIETNAVSEEDDNLIEEDGERSIVSEGLISYQEANRSIPFYLFGDGQENSSFSGKVGLFRIWLVVKRARGWGTVRKQQDFA
jgi:hypothetical protein